MTGIGALAAGWDRAYLGTPPWDIGRPQRAFADVAARLAGTVVEFGCGTGEQTLLAAEQGADAIGLDVSPRAIGLARAKAAARGFAARFETADVLDAATVSAIVGAGAADALIDAGTFHMFEARDRRRYAASATRVVREGGCCLLLCARPDPIRHWGPAGVTAADVAAAFGEEWRVAGATDAGFEADGPLGAIAASMITVVRQAAARPPAA